MTYVLPGGNKRWIQTNESDRFGTLEMTKNINFDSSGYLQLSKRLRTLYDTSNDAQFTAVRAFVLEDSSNAWYVLTTSGVFYFNYLFTTMTQNEEAGAPTSIDSDADMCNFNGDLYISCGVTDDLKRWNGSAWTTPYSLTDAGPMEVFKNKVELAIGQGSSVILLNTSHVLQETLVIPSDYKVISMAWSNNRLYIGTRNRRGEEALLFEWDGYTSSANNAYPCGSNRIDSVKAYQNTVVCMTGNGQLLAFTGAGLEPLARLPVYYTDYLYTRGPSTTNHVVAHRGMAVDGDNIYINARSLFASFAHQNQPQFMDKFPGGIWCYNPNVGLYHKYALGIDKKVATNAVTTANVNTSTEVITVAGVTVPETGTPVLYDDGNYGLNTAIGGLTHRKKYYTIYQSDTTMKLATTKANADAGTAIDLTGTGNNAQYFVFIGNQDFGAGFYSGDSAVAVMEESTPAPSDAMKLLAGGFVNTAYTGGVDAVAVLTKDSENRGFAVTTRLDASAIEDKYFNVCVKYDGIKDAEDKIIVKFKRHDRNDTHRTIDGARTQRGTWVDTDTFTTTYDMSDVNAGDEVTIQNGVGGGYTFHISSITEAGGTYTVNLDEKGQKITASDTMLFTVDTWEKLFTITTDDLGVINNDNGTFTPTGGAKEHKVAATGTKFQIKLELRGEDVKVEDLLINNKPFNTFIV